VNQTVLKHLPPEHVEVEIWRADELEVRRGLRSELDEMWSYVRSKAHPRWLWHAIDHHTGKVLASVFGRRQDTVFLELKALLEPFGITRYFTDGWGAYERHVEAEPHTVGKAHTQKIESKHINLRTRIKRLVRRTICFSKTEHMHDLVIGLFINRYEFGRPISHGINRPETPSALAIRWRCREVGDGLSCDKATEISAATLLLTMKVMSLGGALVASP